MYYIKMITSISVARMISVSQFEFNSMDSRVKENISKACFCLILVFIGNGSPEYDAYVWNKILNLICLRHLFALTLVSNLIISFKKGLIFFTRAHLVSSYHLKKVRWL